MKSLLPLFVMAICCSTIASGQTQQQATGNETTIRSGPITLSAEQVISDSTIGSIKARGNVTGDLRNGTFKFQADEVEVTIDRNAGLIKVLLRGNVRAEISRDGSTRTIEANAAEFHAKL